MPEKLFLGVLIFFCTSQTYMPLCSTTDEWKIYFPGRMTDRYILSGRPLPSRSHYDV